MVVTGMLVVTRGQLAEQKHSTGGTTGLDVRSQAHALPPFPFFLCRTHGKSCLLFVPRSISQIYQFRYPVRSRFLLLMMLVRSRAGMWCVPEERQDCRRILNVTFGSTNGRGVCVPPSRYVAVLLTSAHPPPRWSTLF